MKVTVHITRRPEISDPQGTTVSRALADLGYNSVKKLRIDRTVHMEVDGEDPDAIRREVDAMCQQLLANPVLEDFEVVVE